MDIVIGLLSAALLIGVSAIMGRSLDRARRQSLERRREDANREDDLYGDF
jgi:hypothetical protein